MFPIFPSGLVDKRKLACKLSIIELQQFLSQFSSDLCLGLNRNWISPGDLNIVIRKLLGLGMEDKVGSVVFCGGTTDFYFNACISGRPLHHPMALAHRRETYLDKLAEAMHTSIVDCGAGWMAYRKR